MLKRLMSCLCTAVVVLAVVPALSFAEETDESVYCIGSAVNAGLDTGYSESVSSLVMTGISAGSLGDSR